MRNMMFVLFTLAGLAAAALLAVPWIPEDAAVELGLVPVALTALGGPELGIVAGSALAASVLFLAFASRPGFGRRPPPFESRPWGRVLQLAFSGSVLLVAAFLLSLALSGGGWLPAPHGMPAPLGVLYTVALVQAGFGTALALALLVLRPGSTNFVATLSVHIMEVALLAVVFFMGYSA